MAITRKTIGSLAVVLSLLGLAACGPATQTTPPTSAPTNDTNPLRTQVAATVLAQVTRDLAQTPAVTPSPPPTATATLTPTATPAQATTAPGTGVVVTATLSSLTPGVGTDHQAEWVSQSIADQSVFEPGETFTMTWRLKNTGPSTWAAGYILRFFGGDPLGSPEEVPLDREVPPGETVDISLQMQAPERPGKYTSVWVMSTTERSNFKEPVYLEIEVPGPATSTPTLIRTPTPTP